MPAGRPTDYSPELIERICSLIADGNSLRRVCMLDDMPDKSTVFRWLREYKEFKDNYEVAVNERTEDDVEDIRDIADDGTNDFVTDDEGKSSVNAENIQRSRLRVDVRKWIASKRLPKKYGDKVELSGDKANPLSVVLQIQSSDEKL